MRPSIAFILCCDFLNVANFFDGNNKDVYPRLWVDVAEGNHKIIAVDKITGDVAVDNFGEYSGHVFDSFA
jgi:hypothetical protein